MNRERNPFQKVQSKLGLKQFTKWIEGQGMSMRRYLQLSPHGILDPFKLANAMGVHTLSLADAHYIPEEYRHQLLVNDTKAWWAGCIYLPSGSALVLYNPTQPFTRLNATIMEELAHIHLKHKSGTLFAINGSIVLRNYQKSKEKQAYSAGAAALLPMAVLKTACALGTPMEKLANERGISVDLVKFRAKITGINLQI